MFRSSKVQNNKHTVPIKGSLNKEYNTYYHFRDGLWLSMDGDYHVG